MAISQIIHPVIKQIESQYRQRTVGSAKHHQAAQQYLPGGDSRTITYFDPHPLYIKEAQGKQMIDVDGNIYLDFLSNYTSMIHGHSHPTLVNAIRAQATNGFGYAACTPLQIRLAEELCNRVAGVELIRFCNSGTEATMNALRAARAFTGRDKILKIEGGYHGSHDWVEISVAPPESTLRAIPEEPGIPQTVVDMVRVIPFNDPKAAEAIFAREGYELAAVIVEPLLGATGTIPAEQDFLTALRSLCDQHGVLLIFDEVISFRVDYGGAQAVYGVRPDLTTFGKVIGGGLPVGAFGGRADIMSLFAPPEPKMVQSGTFNANPMTLTTGLAAMQLLTVEEIVRINQLGTQLATGLQRAFEKMRVKGQVTGMGSLCTVHFTTRQVRDYDSFASGDIQAQRLLHLGLLNRGIFIAKRGMFVISTPMNETDVKTCLSAFASSLKEIRPYLVDEVPHLLQ